MRWRRGCCRSGEPCSRGSSLGCGSRSGCGRRFGGPWSGANSRSARWRFDRPCPPDSSSAEHLACLQQRWSEASSTWLSTGSTTLPAIDRGLPDRSLVRLSRASLPPPVRLPRARSVTNSRERVLLFTGYPILRTMRTFLNEFFGVEPYGNNQRTIQWIDSDALDCGPRLEGHRSRPAATGPVSG